MAISSNLRILLVDDDPDIRQTLKLILQKIGFKNIKMCANAPDTLKYLGEKTVAELPLPEFIMSDYDMPGGSGIDLFTSLKKNPATAAIPFLLISGVSDRSFVIEAKEIGIRFILLKPFTQQTLVKEMARMLN